MESESSRLVSSAAEIWRPAKAPPLPPSPSHNSFCPSRGSWGAEDWELPAPWEELILLSAQAMVRVDLAVLSGLVSVHDACTDNSSPETGTKVWARSFLHMLFPSPPGALPPWIPMDSKALLCPRTQTSHSSSVLGLCFSASLPQPSGFPVPAAHIHHATLRCPAGLRALPWASPCRIPPVSRLQSPLSSGLQ